MIIPFRRFVCLVVALLTLVGNLSAGSSTWTDVKGNTFKGAPSAVYGANALFKSGNGKGRRVLLRTLPPEECVRFYQESGKEPARAEVWAKSRSSVSRSLIGYVKRVEKGALVPVDFKAMPEPDFFVVFFGSAWDGHSYKVPGLFRGAYERVKTLFGDRIEMVCFGIHHDAQASVGFATGSRMNFLAVEYADQSVIDLYRDYCPEKGDCRLMLVSRDGVPLAMSTIEKLSVQAVPSDSLQGVKRFIDAMNLALASSDELNPFFWKDRAYYESSIRPTKYATSSAPPLLIGQPLRASMLRKHDVKRVTATLEVDVSGGVTSATISNAATMPAGMASQIERGLAGNAIFVPAIEKGMPKPGTYTFDYFVPTEKVARELDRDWLHMSGRPEVKITTWHLLRPIPVNPVEFSKVDHVDREGNIVMTPVLISKDKVSQRAQLSAFSHDFFEEKGAGSVEPFVGKEEEIEEKKYKWERIEAGDGYVDLRTKENCDNSVGYAWAEFDVAREGPAFLGLGSDDGVKVWFNGELIHDRWVGRTCQIDQDVVPIQLLSGKNTILIKIQNRKTDWAFFTRIRR